MTNQDNTAMNIQESIANIELGETADGDIFALGEDEVAMKTIMQLIQQHTQEAYKKGYIDGYLIVGLLLLILSNLVHSSLLGLLLAIISFIYILISMFRKEITK